MYKDISSYGVIGNLETCALVGRDGSVDWLCLPHLGSPSVFGALLDAGRGGMFRISPLMRYDSTHSYVSSTNILRTEFVTPTGNALLTDFMPVRSGGSARRVLLRKLEGTRGITWLRATVRPRFDYGRARMAAAPDGNGVAFRGGNDVLYLRSPSGVAWTLQGDAAEGEVTVKQGEAVWFVLSHGGRMAADEEACGALLEDTRKYWEGWVDRYLHLRGVFDEPWRDVVIRSGLALKLLINPETGAIAAAATTSLPERPGGIRNWDYRLAWLRDSSFTVQALYHLGDINELSGYDRWIKRTVGRAKEAAKIRIVYALHGEEDIREAIIDNFSGYRDSGPVRVGNAAVEQWQLDIYGELVNGIYETSRYGAAVSPETWGIVRDIVDYVCRAWKDPDNGIWEFRGSPRHFVYSKLMCWVAVDRALRIAAVQRYDAPLSSWKKAKKEIAAALLERGFDEGRNSFVQSFGSRDIDAASLLIPLMGFLPFGDPRVRGTIEAVRRELVVNDCLVYRYRADDGLAGNEGCFTICSFWLVKALALSGKKEEAEELFKKTLRYMSPQGLLSEQIDPRTGGQLGNFPQAFSHIGLINASLYLGIAKGKQRAGPAPSGSPAPPCEDALHAG